MTSTEPQSDHFSGVGHHGCQHHFSLGKDSSFLSLVKLECCQGLSTVYFRSGGGGVILFYTVVSCAFQRSTSIKRAMKRGNRGRSRSTASTSGRSPPPPPLSSGGSPSLDSAQAKFVNTTSVVEFLERNKALADQLTQSSSSAVNVIGCVRLATMMNPMMNPTVLSRS